MHIFFNYTTGYLKFCKRFCIFKMAWSSAFQKCIFYHFSVIIFCQHFYYNWFLQKTILFLKICNFFADSKSKSINTNYSGGRFRQSAGSDWFLPLPPDQEGPGGGGCTQYLLRRRKRGGREQGGVNSRRRRSRWEYDHCSRSEELYWRT